MSDMDKISNGIYDYYLDHFDEMPFDNQFHFASRLHLWCRDPRLAAILHDLRSEFTFNDNPAVAVEALIQKAKDTPVHGAKNAAKLRRPYFEKYPQLRTYVTVLFRLTFLQNIYGLDARALFYEHFPQAEVEVFADKLLADTDAIAILSTHAINFLYLYERVIKQDDTSLNPAQFLNIGRTGYDVNDKMHLQLLIYLYTHCIIGESQFYYRSLPVDHLPAYRTMIQELETLITERFDDINLDNKFEFLVAAQLVGTESSLAPAIWDEAGRSLSPEGTFIIDTHNGNPQTANSGFAKSEHRNVLCIMADRQFQPTNS
ncbi:hypothetical protein BH09PAT3_BH09PAT3_0920 [soil metagenome]